MRKPKPRHGGRRSGAGRPASDPSGAKRPVTLWLSPAEIEHCRQVAGSPQQWVRNLLAVHLAK